MTKEQKENAPEFQPKHNPPKAQTLGDIFREIHEEALARRTPEEVVADIFAEPLMRDIETMSFNFRSNT